MHPAAKMLVDLANAQDIEAGDGTTTVVVVAGSLLGAAEKLLKKGRPRSKMKKCRAYKARHTPNRYLRIISARFSRCDRNST